MDINNKIFNDTAETFKGVIYGRDEDNRNRALAVDSDGRLILSPSLRIDVDAADLDIRNLNSVNDYALITNSPALDIRALKGTRDSTKIMNKSYVEDADSGTIVALGTRIFLTKNISSYKNNQYLVRNTGGVGVTITLQIAPIDSEAYYTNDGSQFNLLAGQSGFFSPTRLMKYARIRVSAVLLGSVTVNYFGQS